MTFDQFTHLLAVLAWPTVALIAGVVAVHCCRLLAEVLADESERWRKSSFELSLLVEERRTRTASDCIDRICNVIAVLGDSMARFGEKLSHDAGFNTTRWLQCIAHLEGFIPAVIRAARTDSDRQKIGKTAETALMTLLAANGGFPGTANDDAVRQIVREVRKLHEEVENPTPEPVGAKEKLRAPNADAGADDLTLDELFSPDDIDDDEEGEL